MKNTLNSFSGYYPNPNNRQVHGIVGWISLSIKMCVGRAFIGMTSSALCFFLSTEISWAIRVCKHISQELVRASLHKRNLLWNQLQRIFTLLKISWKIHLLENEIAFSWVPPSPLKTRDPWASDRIREGRWQLDLICFLKLSHYLSYYFHSCWMHVSWRSAKSITYYEFNMCLRLGTWKT